MNDLLVPVPWSITDIQITIIYELMLRQEDDFPLSHPSARVEFTGNQEYMQINHCQFVVEFSLSGFSSGFAASS